jgi:anti-sigma regulatory factor (Ser/Thr protein kinase)
MTAPEPTGGGSPDLGQDPAVALDQTFNLDRLYALRSALVAHGSELGAAVPELDRLVLVASELATNAVRHGGGSGRLRLWRHGDALVCEVSDWGPGIADPATGTDPVDPGARGGRGLWICRQLADEVWIRDGSPGAVVTVSITVTSS